MKINLKDNFKFYFAIVLTILTFTYVFCITFIKYDSEKRDLVNMVTGGLLGSCLFAVVSFFYSSSISSKEKTEALIDASKKTA